MFNNRMKSKVFDTADLKMRIANGVIIKERSTMSGLGNFAAVSYLLALLAFIQPATAAGQQLERQGDYTAGSIHYGLAIETVDYALMVTAVRLTNGDLRLIAWEVSYNPEEEIVRKGHVTSSGPVTQVAMVAMGNRRVVTAARNEDGNLHLILWQISQDGLQIEKLDEYVAGGVNEISLVYLTTNQFVTAVRLTDNKLKLIVWHLEGDHIERKGSVLGGLAKKVSVVSTFALNYGYGVVTAVRDNNNKLKLTSWSISDDGLTILYKDGIVTNELIEAVATTYYSHILTSENPTTTSDVIVTAVRTAEDDLKVIVWEVTRDTNQTISRKSDLSDGPIGGVFSKIAITRVDKPGYGGQLVTAVRDSNGNLKLVVWSISLGQIIRLGESYEDAITDLAMNRLWSPKFVTAVRTASGNLKLISWRTY